jgi:hypothetical protein
MVFAVGGELNLGGQLAFRGVILFRFVFRQLLNCLEDEKVLR